MLRSGTAAVAGLCCVVHSVACGGGEGDVPPVDAGPADSGPLPVDAGPADLGTDAFTAPDLAVEDMGTDPGDAGTCTCWAPAFLQ